MPCGIEGCRVTSLTPRARRRAGPRRLRRHRRRAASARSSSASPVGDRAAALGLDSAGARDSARTSDEPQAAERIHVTRSRAKPGGTAAAADGTVPFRRARKPPWLKVPAPGGPNYRRLKATIGADNLHTVCEEANCPNVGECWERGTATFMILGDVCTRRCGFCNVQTGKPTWNDPLEPLRVANQVKQMGLRHAVVTSVDRDDLPDYGASAFVGVIRSIRMLAPGCKVEVLTPDFRGQEMPLAKVIHERPDVFNHNVETVPRLYPKARRGSQFLRSARVLRMAKEMGGDDVVTKSGLMVGLGETFEEMVETFGILREHRVQVLTVGQYLRPTENHLPVVRYWHPDEFEALEKAAYELGFESVAAGPAGPLQLPRRPEPARGRAGREPHRVRLAGARLGVEPAGIEPATSGLQTRALCQLSYGPSPESLGRLTPADALVVEVEVLRRLLLEPELVVLGGVLEEVRGVLEHVLVGRRRRGLAVGRVVLGSASSCSAWLGPRARRRLLDSSSSSGTRLRPRLVSSTSKIAVASSVAGAPGSSGSGASSAWFELVGEPLLAEELVEFVGRLVLVGGGLGGRLGSPDAGLDPGQRVDRGEARLGHLGVDQLLVGGRVGLAWRRPRTGPRRRTFRSAARRSRGAPRSRGRRRRSTRAGASAARLGSASGASAGGRLGAPPAGRRCWATRRAARLLVGLRRRPDLRAATRNSVGASANGSRLVRAAPAARTPRPRAFSARRHPRRARASVPGALGLRRRGCSLAIPW